MVPSEIGPIFIRTSLITVNPRAANIRRTIRFLPECKVTRTVEYSRVLVRSVALSNFCHPSSRQTPRVVMRWRVSGVRCPLRVTL